jgi:hypothetical protein
MLCRGTSPGENSASWGVGSVEVRGVGDDGDERGTGSATEFGPACDAGNAFQTGAVGDSEPADAGGCSAAGHVFVSVDGTWGVRFSCLDRRRYRTAIAISMAIAYFFNLISVLVIVLQLRFIGKKTGLDSDGSRDVIQ